jgi:hypothetical protein
MSGKIFGIKKREKKLIKTKGWIFQVVHYLKYGKSKKCDGTHTNGDSNSSYLR